MFLRVRLRPQQRSREWAVLAARMGTAGEETADLSAQRSQPGLNGRIASFPAQLKISPISFLTRHAAGKLESRVQTPSLPSQTGIQLQILRRKLQKYRCRVCRGLAGRRCPGASTPQGRRGSEAAPLQTPPVRLGLFRTARVQDTLAPLGGLRGRTSASGVPSRRRHAARPAEALVALQQIKFNRHSITREILAPGRPRCSHGQALAERERVMPAGAGQVQLRVMPKSHSREPARNADCFASAELVPLAESLSHPFRRGGQPAGSWPCHI